MHDASGVKASQPQRLGEALGCIVTVLALNGVGEGGLR